MKNGFDSAPPGTDGIGSIDKWVCGNCLHENYEDPMTPRNSRPFICIKCGVKRGVVRVYDTHPMRYDWKEDFCSTWIAKDGNYMIKADREKLVLLLGEQIICEKAFYGDFAGKSVDSGRPESIRAEDGEGFGEISYFVFNGMGALSPVVGVIERQGETVKIDFGKGFAGMSINGWKCSCGQGWNSDRFCSNCGLPKPIGIPQISPECGNVFDKNEKNKL